MKTMDFEKPQAMTQRVSVGNSADIAMRPQIDALLSAKNWDAIGSLSGFSVVATHEQSNAWDCWTYVWPRQKDLRAVRTAERKLLSQRLEEDFVTAEDPAPGDFVLYGPQGNEKHVAVFL